MRRTWARAGIVAVALAVGITGCTAQSPEPEQTPSESEPSEEAPAPAGGTLTIGARVDNNSFDPADLEIGNRVQYWQPVYDTLIALDPEANPQPNLATEWSYNEDNTVLTLTLRDDVTFTDGEVFDGEAVKANIEHIKAGTGQNRFMVEPIEEVVVNSPTEVELHLSEPVPSLVPYLGWVGGVMASPAALASGTIAQNPVGSGPYIYAADQSSPGTEYRYTRNPDYWNASAYPYDEVVVKPINDVTPLLNALKTGQINGALLTPAVAAEAEAGGATVNALSVAWVGFIIADRQGTMVPELADVRVRQALNHAFDKQAMVDFILQGHGEVTSQLFNVASQAFDESLDDAYSYDPELAKELMAEAGVDGFEVTVPQWPGPWTDLFPILAAQAAEIGVTINYQQVPADQAISSVLSGDYPIAFFPLASATAWQDVQTWITPTAPWNMLGAQDPELDALIEKAQFAGEDEQEAAFQEINQWLVDNAWFAPLFRQDQIFGTTPDTEVTMQAQNAVPSLSSFRPAGS